MALFLRAGLHGLRYTLRAQREWFKIPESRNVRWYGETAILEDSSTAANDAAFEIGASIMVSDAKVSDDAGIVKQTSTKVNLKPENGPKESSADKLTNLILAKMQAKNNSGGASPSPPGSASSKSVKPTEKGSESSRGDKWDQVMESMRNMAAKRREQLARNASGKGIPTRQQYNKEQDDYSDLDYAAVQNNKAPSDLPSADEKFQAHTESVKHKESSFQSSNAKQKPRPVSFSFLKGPDNESPTGRPQSTRSASDGNIGTISSSKSKDSGFPPPSKGAKPLSFEFLKPSDAKVQLSKPPEAKSVSESGVQYPNDSPRPLFQNQKRESNVLTGAAGAHAHQISAVEVKQEMNNALSPHPFCFMVVIRNVSSQTNLALIREALSIHGEVITSYKKPNLDGSYIAFVEFKTGEAMEDALAARWLQIDSMCLSIAGATAPITTVVRLSRVSANADCQVLAVCEQFGQVTHVRKHGGSIYDVYYKAGELTNMAAILDRLNEVTFNQRRWVAFPAPRLHVGARKDVLRSGEGQAWHAQQMKQTLSRLDMGLEAMSVYFDDLKALVGMEEDLVK